MEWTIHFWFGKETTKVIYNVKWSKLDMNNNRKNVCDELSNQRGKKKGKIQEQEGCLIEMNL